MKPTTINAMLTEVMQYASELTPEKRAELFALAGPNNCGPYWDTAHLWLAMRTMQGYTLAGVALAAIKEME